MRFSSRQWCLMLIGGAWLSAAIAEESATEATYLTYAGHAFDTDSGDKVYSEVHQVKTVNGKAAERIVSYRCPNGKVFARKRVQASRLPSAPQFALEDKRLDYVEGLEVGAENLSVYVKQAGRAERKTEVLTDPPADLVADAGFDVLVRDNWEALVAGETVHFHFLVPSRLEYLKFKVKQVSEEKIGDREARTFRLALGGLLGLVVSGIDVSYDTENRTILQFAGLSNVRDPDGDNYVVRLDFPPAERIPQTDSAAFDGALAEDLVSSCD